MRTVVIQSYRPVNVAEWIRACLQTVKAWAKQSGYDYYFLGDELFDRVPQRIRNHPPASLLPLTDIARLAVLKEKLAADYDRAIWIDADVVIFRPDQFRIPDKAGALLCHEVWTGIDDEGRVTHQRRINNAVLVFDRGHPLLDFLHYASIELLTHHGSEQAPPNTVGTNFLSKLGKIIPLKLLTQVACLSPPLLHAIFSQSNSELVSRHAQAFAHEFHAANLCASIWHSPEMSPSNSQYGLDDAQLHQVVRLLVANNGAALAFTGVDSPRISATIN